MELLADYVHHGCTHVSDVGPSRILAHMLRVFRAAGVDYAGNHLRPECSEMFASAPSRRLHEIGLCSMVPAIKGFPEWPQERMLACTRHVIALRKDVDPQNAAEWIPEITRLLATPLDTKLPVPWSTLVQGDEHVQRAQQPSPEQGVVAFCVSCRVRHHLCIACEANR